MTFQIGLGNDLEIIVLFLNSIRELDERDTQTVMSKCNKILAVCNFLRGTNNFLWLLILCHV